MVMLGVFITPYSLLICLNWLASATNIFQENKLFFLFFIAFECVCCNVRNINFNITYVQLKPSFYVNHWFEGK